jgi:GT2 family glycosyltransferase
VDGAVESGMEKAPPLVSVILPTFDRPDYLRLALASAVGQSYRHLEIIVQDNASPVDPRPVVESFQDPRIAYFRNDENIGITANVVTACAKAHGRYIAILGDDDLWQPDFIATLVAPLERDDSLAVAFCDHDIIGPDGAVDRIATERVSRRWGRHLLRRGPYRPFGEIAVIRRSICIFSGALLRRDDIDWSAIPLDMSYGLDMYVVYLAARTGKGCYYVPQRLAQYRYHPGSTASGLRQAQRRIANARDSLRYWTALRQDDALRRYWRYFEMRREFNALVIVAALLCCGESGTAWRQLRRFWSEGLVRPHILLQYPVYALRLRRATA